MTTTATSPSVHQYALDPRGTRITFTTRHLMGLSEVRGTVELVHGRAEVDEAGALLAVEAEVDLASFASGSRARDAAVASPRLLGTAAHPRAVFRSVLVEQVAAGWQVHGDLVVKGVRAPLTLQVHDVDAVRGRARASARVDRRHHGIAIPAALAATHLQVEVEVRSARSDG